jgi:hypothetical protein
VVIHCTKSRGGQEIAITELKMKKQTSKTMVGVLLGILVLAIVGGGWYFWDMNKTPAPAPQTPTAQGQTVIVQSGGMTLPSAGLVYVDLSGNIMDKAKFATSSANAYAGVVSQSVLFYDITKNPQNDPRTNLAAVPDFQVVGTATGVLSATKQGIAGHTYVYFFENTTGTYYDVTGTFTIPANINPFAPSFDIGNILAPAVGTLKTYNESNIETDNVDGPSHRNMNGLLASSTVSTDYRIEVGSQTYAEFLRIWGEYTSTGIKAQVLGISAVQKAGPSTGVSIDSSDEKNPIITVNELTAQYPVTFTYYVQGAATVDAIGNYTIYADDWNAVPGKFGSKIDSLIIVDLT